MATALARTAPDATEKQQRKGKYDVRRFPTVQHVDQVAPGRYLDRLVVNISLIWGSLAGSQ